MTEPRIYTQRPYTRALELFFQFAASGMVPARWFRRSLPFPADRHRVTHQPHVELVSHCWQYAPMLWYQLSSIVRHPPTKLSLTVTVFYAAEDAPTKRVLDFIGGQEVDNVEWNWQALPKEHCFRRGIGRNRAALNTQADWVWMTDCDVLFQAGSLDSLAEELTGRTDTCCFPRQEYRTVMLANTDDLLARAEAQLQSSAPLSVLGIDESDFHPHTLQCAKGEYQIIHGDVARAIGYCDGIRPHQTPANHWCKCREDRVFRWLAGTQGTPIDVTGVYQIRHLHKGRYRGDNTWSRWRSRIRRVQDFIRN